MKTIKIMLTIFLLTSVSPITTTVLKIEAAFVTLKSLDTERKKSPKTPAS